MSQNCIIITLLREVRRYSVEGPVISECITASKSSTF
jgi:hypothetical protein